MSLETIVARDAETIHEIASQTHAVDPNATKTVGRFDREKPEVYVIGAKDGDRFVGRLNLQTVADEPEVAEACPESAVVVGLFVNPDARRRGIAWLLMKAAEEESIRLGYASICLGVEENNESARHLYEKLQYRYTDITYEVSWPEQDEGGSMKTVTVDAMLMKKQLE